MKWIDNITPKVEWFFMNIVGTSVTGWLASIPVSFSFSSIIAALVGVTVIVYNIVKIRGQVLDNRLKRNQLNDNEKKVQ